MREIIKLEGLLLKDMVCIFDKHQKKHEYECHICDLYQDLIISQQEYINITSLELYGGV